jgi:hypothetical protein
MKTTFNKTARGTQNLRAFKSLVLAAAGLVCGTTLAQAASKLDEALSAYDAAIAADSTAALAKLTNAIALEGRAGSPFDFGPTSGDTTMEFILEGDPTIGADGYLAVGENTSSNLRYAQWSNTRQMGFTRLGVAD